jgi:hypothetical protein
MNNLDRLLTDEEYQYQVLLKRRLLIEDYERNLFNYLKEEEIKMPTYYGVDWSNLTYTLMSSAKHLPEIKQVIFNNPATIIMWKDGTKTIVKVHNEEFDEEKGFAMAYLKKVFGDRNKYMKYIKNASRQEKKEV